MLSCYIIESIIGKTPKRDRHFDDFYKVRMVDVVLKCIEVSAFAKVNLRLKILGERADGYHELSMINCNISLADSIVIRRGLGASVQLKVLILDKNLEPDSRLVAELRDESKNLFLRAAKQFLERFDLSDQLDFELTKRIPAGAGLGGGSSDAASVIVALQSMYFEELQNRGTSLEEVYDYCSGLALSLGADLPYCMIGGMCQVSGIGELVTPVGNDLKAIVNKRPAILVVPKVHVSTESVFRAYRAQNTNKKQIDKDIELQNQLAQINSLSQPWIKMKGLFENDLWPITSKIAPLVGEIGTALMKDSNFCVIMSGSGCSFLAIPIDDIDSGSSCKKLLRSLDKFRGKFDYYDVSLVA